MRPLRNLYHGGLDSGHVERIDEGRLVMRITVPDVRGGRPRTMIMRIDRWRGGGYSARIGKILY